MSLPNSVSKSDKMEPILDHKFRLADDVVFIEVENQAVMLSMSTGKYYGIIGIGFEILNRLDKLSSGSDLVFELVQEYNEKKETIKKDITDLFEDLLKAGLITPI